MLKSSFSPRQAKNTVVSFVGFVNFLKIPNKVLNEITWYIDGNYLKRLVQLKIKASLKSYCFDFSGIADIVLRDAEKSKYKVLFIGGSQKEIKIFLSLIKKKYSLLNCEGIDGYESLERIGIKNKNNYDIAIYGLGSPLQEIVALENRKSFTISYTCGAFISQTARSKGEYYPFLFKFFGAKWLFRILKEPRHFSRVLDAFLKTNIIIKKLEGIRIEL